MKNLILVLVALVGFSTTAQESINDINRIDFAYVLPESVTIVSKVVQPGQHPNYSDHKMYSLTVKFTVSLADSCQKYLGLQALYDVDASDRRISTTRYNVLEYSTGGACMFSVSEETIQVRLPNLIRPKRGDDSFMLNDVKYFIKIENDTVRLIGTSKDNLGY